LQSEHSFCSITRSRNFSFHIYGRAYGIEYISVVKRVSVYTTLRQYVLRSINVAKKIGSAAKGERVYMEHNSRVVFSRTRKEGMVLKQTRIEDRYRSGTDIVLVSRDSHLFAVLSKSSSNLDAFKLVSSISWSYIRCISVEKSSDKFANLSR